MICVSIADCTYENTLKLAEKSDMIELRLDSLNFDREELCEIIKKSKSSIATMRPGDYPDSHRVDQLKYAIDCGVQYVDVEIDSSDSFKNEIISYIKNKKTGLIISYHNYEKTPVRRELDEVIRWSEESNADICKIACQVNSEKDSAVLLSLYELDKKIISIGMGEKGRITRVASILLGAPFTFAAISDDKLTAPGQLAEEKIKYIMELIENG